MNEVEKLKKKIISKFNILTQNKYLRSVTNYLSKIKKKTLEFILCKLLVISHFIFKFSNSIIFKLLISVYKKYLKKYVLYFCEIIFRLKAAKLLEAAKRLLTENQFHLCINAIQNTVLIYQILNTYYQRISLKNRVLLFSAFILILIFQNLLPYPLFTDPICTVIESRDGVLLGAHIATDGQWRFPATDNVPEKYKKALLNFEDKRFKYHWGFDIASLFRAAWLNIKYQQVVSGGSTIPMQVIRLSRKGTSRTITEKIWEIILAIRLEFSYSKDQILALYASNAPFGGNTVGLDAAAWRYFERKANNLSWAESCMLAVLPNSPSLIHPGKNRPLLFDKRNKLLKKLLENQIIDSTTYQLSIEEPIPEQPKPFPMHASHLLNRADKELVANNSQKNARIKTTIDASLQIKVNLVVNQHHKRLSGNGINNIAAIAVEVETGEVLVYVGNVGNINDKRHGNQVDVITAPRSTGSILKPLLYASMLTSGDILPDALVADIPTQIGNYIPQNYNIGFDGAVPAKRALARSLNVPAIKMLQVYGVPRFHNMLEKIGMTTLNKPAIHYGLSLILGGCEGKLWDLVGIYASMSRTLKHFAIYDGQYDKNDFHAPIYLHDNQRDKREPEFENSSYFSAAATWFAFEAMLDVERPDDEVSWQSFSSSKRVAWKTGTSFGFRDAWAIGVTPDYVVGIWCGNADGEGRPELLGIRAAAPVLFDVFNLLTTKQLWFHKPLSEMASASLCRQSGYLASDICDVIDTVLIPTSGSRFSVCPYHKIVHLDKTGKWRVNSDCENPSNMQHLTWFVLPPTMEWYYKSHSSTYKVLPPFRSDCLPTLQMSKNASMQIIYPHDFTKIYVPTELDGTLGSAIFEVAHRNASISIFWHLDQQYIGATKIYHRMALRPSKGKHTITLVDENGETLSQDFEILNQKK